MRDGIFLFDGAVSCGRMVAREQLPGLPVGRGPTSAPAHGRGNGLEMNTTTTNIEYFVFRSR